MSIKATFASGSSATTTKTLYQWDLGQQLEIEAADLPTEIEVHFSCRGLNEAIVVPCSVTLGVGIVTIPNQCLEQAGAITAWVYEYEAERDEETGKIVKTAGATTKTITIPITSRARPNRSEDIPQNILDKYAELIVEVNEAIGALQDGDVTVKNAENSQFATAAGNANIASSAWGLIGKRCALASDGTYTLPTENYTGLYIGIISENIFDGVTSFLFVGGDGDYLCGSEWSHAEGGQYMAYSPVGRKISWFDGSNHNNKITSLYFIPVVFPER